MKKNSKYFYVEMKGKDGNPTIFPHTIEKRRGELLYKFDTEFDAKLFLDTLLDENPNDKFRIVKIEESYIPSEWCWGEGK